MNKGWTMLAALFIVIVLGVLALIFIPGPHVANAPTNDRTATTTSLDDVIVITSPQPGTTVTSPLTITGKARGNWYFEASFPIELFENEPGSALIANTAARAQGDWMTQDFVPFTATITFDTSIGITDGELVLHNDNPSGEPTKDREVRIPVKFKPH